jgi:hypothetical protein
MEPKRRTNAAWCNDNGTIIYPVQLCLKYSYHIAAERNKEASVGAMVLRRRTRDENV